MGEEGVDARRIGGLDLAVALEAVLLVELGVQTDVLDVDVGSGCYGGPQLLLLPLPLLLGSIIVRIGAGAGAGIYIGVRVGIGVGVGVASNSG